MTREKLALLVLLVGSLSACGGRSALYVHGVDGGADRRGDGGSDTLRADGGLLADAVPTDALRADVLGPDARLMDAAPDRAPDAILPTDARDAAPIDVRPGTDTARTDGIVTPTLAGIELAPSAATIVAGVAYSAFVVTAVMSDGATADVTADASFTSDAPSVLAVSGHTATGVKAGVATVTVNYKGKTATAKITVTNSPLQSISIEGVAPLTVGQSILLTATGIFANGTKQDITALATWTSSNNALAKVALDSATARARVQAGAAGSVTISASYQGLTSGAQVTVTAAALKRIDITPAQANMQRGLSQAFQATATYDDGTTGDVTRQATWSSNRPTVAAVAATASGVTVQAVGAGTAIISATVGKIEGTSSVTVTTPTLVAMKITTPSWSPNVGGTQAFTALGAYSDGTVADVTLSATWSSSNPSVVSVSNGAGQKGQANALAVGSAEIRASLAGQVASASVVVSASPLLRIDITPNPLALVVGLKASLLAMGRYQNGGSQDLTQVVTWTSSDSKVATVSNAAGSAGQVMGVGVGTTSVVAMYNSVAAKTVVTVAAAKLIAITIKPEMASIAAGNTQLFTAAGVYDNGATLAITNQVTWQSSNISVAQVSNAAGSNGQAAALTAGTTTITATMNGVTGKAALTVTPPQLSSIMIAPAIANIEVKGTTIFTVTAVYQNGTTAQVTGATWSSSEPSVAAVDATGGGRRGAIVTGLAAGTTTITASYQGKSDSAILTVTSVPTLVGLTIAPSNPPTILVGATQQFQLTAVYSNGSTSNATSAASWTSSNAKVAAVSNGEPSQIAGVGGRGLATGIGAGTATITAAYNGFTATASLSVRNPTPVALVLTPSSPSIRVNDTQQFTALLTLDDGTTQTVTNAASWTTSNGSVASITTGPGGGFPGGARGLATGLTAGTVTVTATYGTFSAKATLTVTAATPTGLVITPPLPTIQVGQSRALVATVVFDDNTTAEVTDQATWSSSDPSVATITSVGGAPGGARPGVGAGGNATGIAPGKAIITATYSGLSATTVLAVTDPALAYIQVTPVLLSLPVQGTTQFTATAVFADNSSRNVTDQATWSSSAPSVVVVTGTGGNVGRVTAMSEGKATLTATYDGMSASATLTVAAVKSISVTPADPTTVLGLPVTFTATALLANDTTFPLGNQVSWTTSAASVATVTAAGVATPVTPGSTKITATFQGISDVSTLTVSSATLKSIAITPNPLSLTLGATRQLTATGTYSDSVLRDLTAVATWQSSNAEVALVSNAAGSRGQITALSSGSAKVTAVFQGVTSAAAVVTVSP